MAWLAVDKCGSERIFSVKPIRSKSNFLLPSRSETNEYGSLEYHVIGSYIILPKGTIRKILGYELTWDNDPVEIR